eukprot:TRINITY_DN2381_c0_g1_i1.p1 TRINITY_DN2381_c0_g1~~TRINITY_DN2381_c0_g1_i1.p1  ORF type:complete len:239 (+),score=70.31 TRINITY_DN2381_c0_g1_i1:1-717(+)
MAIRCGLGVLLAVAAVIASSSFDPNRMRLIDVVKTADGNDTNYFYRGNLPITSNHTFAMRAVYNQAAILAKQANLTLPAELYFVDLSLLDLELEDAFIEKNYFEKNPENGEYVSLPTVGDLVAPKSVSETLRKELARDLPRWQIDKLPSKMDKLHTLLRKTYPQPALVYIHCEAGMDRTGEMSGSYYLHALNYTFAHALAVDNSIESRSISKYSRNAFQWYCYYLQYTTEPWRNCTLP